MSFLLLNIFIMIISIGMIIFIVFCLRKMKTMREAYPGAFHVEGGDLMIHNLLQTTFHVDEVDYVEFYRERSRFCPYTYMMRVHLKSGKKSIGFAIATSVNEFDKQAALANRYHIPVGYGKW